MPKYPKLYYLGLTALAISLTWFLLLIYSPILETDFLDELGAFFVNYGISVLYFISIFLYHQRVRKKHGEPWYKIDGHNYSIALVLFSISAHSLNFTDIKVFSPYVDWMVIYVILMHGAVLLFPFRSLLPENLRFSLHFINGAGLVLAFYLTIFIFPILVLAIPGGILFGISFHATVPLWFLIYFVTAWFNTDKNPWNKRSYITGIMVPLLAFSVFVYQWTHIQEDIKDARAEFNAQQSHDLPEWVYLASALPSDLLTQKVLMASGQTQLTYWQNMDIIGSGPSGSQFTRHNPIALAALTLYGDIDMNLRDKIKLFEAQYDCRHMTHRRLWSGEQLITTSVKSEIDVYPQYRLAYEEMTLVIHHENKRSPDRWRGEEEEAVYSFYLPEGSIATSLSLWINGIEEKSRLTTKSKADSAYRTIVGRERRDPALMHWQEGNRVSVTVFPCTPEEDRVFKVGFTTPLRYREGKLFLKHVSFDGPSKGRAKAEINLRFPDMDSYPSNLDLPRFWKKKDKEVVYKDLYQANWEISFDAPALDKSSAFEWNGNSYHLEEATADLVSWKPDRIILDVNSSWTWARYNQIWNRLKGHDLWAYLPEPTKVTEENYRDVFEKLEDRSFTMIPFYKSEAGEKTLVITASNGHGPLLKDLKNTYYAANTGDFFKSNELDIRIFTLTEELAPYIQSLRELRLLEVEGGKVEKLFKALEDGKFESWMERTNSQHIAISGMNIRRDSVSKLATKAPDHLYRLFAYQSLMTGIGGDYYEKGKIERDWVKKAESAYILSPVSSLIVLETQKDYDRFGIKKNKNTVGNAAIDKAIANQDGSVPEPHEWALILCMSVVLVAIGWKKWISN